MITLTLTNEQARQIVAALGTASHCYCDFPIEMHHEIKLIERITKQISDQLPDGCLESKCKVAHTVEPESRNNQKPNRI